MSGRLARDTPLSAGPIAVLRIHADRAALAGALGVDPPEPGHARLVRLHDLDDAVLAAAASDHWLLMPHGGPAVVRAIASTFGSRGFTGARATDRVYVEAADPIEHAMLAALTCAASPLAIDLLLRQPERWRRLGAPTDADDPRRARLDRLVHPPLVVALGAPNCGKSTLAGALAGRPVSIVSAHAGTTRDPVIAEVELDGLVVRWADAAGLAATRDPVEALGIATGLGLAERADLVVALAEPGGGWPPTALGDALRVSTKADLGSTVQGAELAVSARLGEGLDGLARAVRSRLVPTADLVLDRPWRFPGAPGAACPDSRVEISCRSRLPDP